MKEKPNAVMVNGIIITTSMIDALDCMQNEGNSILHEFGDNLDELLNELIVGPTDRTPEENNFIASSVIYFKKLLKAFRASGLDPDTITVKIEITQ